MNSEERCARLIERGRQCGPLGGMVLVDDGYTDDEIRIADEAVQRLTDGKTRVARGSITMNLGTTSSAFRSQVVQIGRLHG